MWGSALNSFTFHFLRIMAPFAKRKKDWIQSCFWIRVFAFLNQCIFLKNTGGCVSIKPRRGDASFGQQRNPLSYVNYLLFRIQGKFLRWYLAQRAWVFCVVFRSAEKLVRTDCEGFPKLTGVGTHPPHPISWTLLSPLVNSPFSPWTALWVGLVTDDHN